MKNNVNEIWIYLKTKGGLDIENYDAHFVEELKRELSLPAEESFENILTRNIIKTEDFIIAFFQTIEPFSAMMSDILKMFETAGAKSTDNNLEIEFNFNDIKSDLKFDLEHFRKWISVWTSYKRKYLVSSWDYHSIWKLRHIFWSEQEKNQDPLFEKWLYEYSQMRRWPDFELKCPAFPGPNLSKLVLRAWNLWLNIVKETRKLGSDRRELINKYLHSKDSTWQESDLEFWSPRSLVQLDTDHWAGSFPKKVYSTFEEIESQNPFDKEQSISRLAKNLELLYQTLPIQQIDEEVLVEEFKDFLSLPIWQKRYELYSIWISTQIIESLNDNPYRIHSYGNKLVFSFSGTHLATFDSFTPRIHLWSELRSPLKNPVGKSRRNSIQPDYTLITDPVTNYEASILAIECKQYKNPSKKNFKNALVDYSNGRINSNVILVNYGIVNDSLLDEIPLPLRQRTFQIGEMRPGAINSINHFRNIIRNTVTARFGLPGESQKQNLQSEGVVTLKWGETPTDLDLYLFIENGDHCEEVSYSNPGNSINHPWATLNNDVRSGTGPEQIKIFRWMKSKYLLAVHNYSNEKDFSQSDATLEFTYDGEKYDFICPRVGKGRWWNVLTLDWGNGRLIETNEIVDEIF